MLELACPRLFVRSPRALGWLTLRVPPHRRLCRPGHPGRQARMDGKLRGFLMSLCAGVATTLGVGFIPLLKCGEDTRARVTAVALAFAAGVMLYISFTEARDEGRKELGEDKKVGEGTIGQRAWFALFWFVGMAVAVALDRMFPEGGDDDAARSNSGAQEVEMGSCPGAAAAWPAQQGADSLISPGGSVDKKSQRVSWVTFLAMTAHNFPEGIATFADGVKDGKRWFAIAIALHNIPEGAAVAIPTYQTSKSLLRAFFMTFLSGLAQPVGAGFAWLLLWASGTNFAKEPFWTGATKAATGGIMVCISLLELVPEALKGVSPLAVTLTMVAAFLVMEGTIIFGEIAEQASQ
uniref:Uncharacterized protein n=1 Tax=Zooxanthella nutricula TaxID=1333877 RepID=A0A7S2KYH1_9DINO